MKDLVAVFALAVVCAAGCGTVPDDGGLDAEAVRTNNRGVALMGRFDYVAALAEFDAVLERYPEHPEVRLNRAIAVLNRQGEGDEAIALATATEVLGSDPDNARAHYCAGVITLYMGEPEDALGHFRRVVELDPADADAAYSVGQGLMQLERPDEALAWYESAVELDPYLRSAYYRGFQSMQRLGRMDEARSWLETFQRLKDNPRARVVEFKYTKMGRKADALTVDLEPGAAKVEPPGGPVFAEPRPMLADVAALGAADAGAGRASVSVCDHNKDGRLDVFVAGGEGASAVLEGAEQGFVMAIAHPLSGIEAVNAALWGDVDNDGLVDAYICRKGANQLWRQSAPGEWQDVTADTGTAAGDLDTVDGALVDADHDGDLDLYLVNADGPNELLNNNRDGTFRSLAADHGIAGDGRPSESILSVDLDNDRDLDLIIVNRDPPHEVYFNRLLWDYEPAEGWQGFAAAEITAAVPADMDADGQVELYTADQAGAISRWAPGEEGVWMATALTSEQPLAPASRLAVADVDGNGSLDLLGSGGQGWWAAALDDARLDALFTSDAGFAAWSLAVLDPAAGAAVIGWTPGVPPSMWPAGSGRHTFAGLLLSGREESSSSLRSNASGIGAVVAVRVDSRWTVLDTVRTDSGPGQSLQPLVVGLGGDPRIDFVAVDWSDGVYQTEMDLAVGEVHTLTETQRQLSSCPVLFAWDGQRYRFVSDLLGVGGMGYFAGPPGVYGEPRPRESFMLPAGLPAERDGRLQLKLGEPMEELTYLDSARLMVYDLPAQWFMTLDERMAISSPEPSGQPRFYQRLIQPVEVVNDRGENVTAEVLEADLKAAPVGELDHRFLGRLEADHVLVLRFDEDLDGRRRSVVLVADGWVEYPYSQTNFAAWQAGADYRAPTLEARGKNGRWRVLRESFGYPAGMPRQMSLPLRRIPSGTRELRLTTNQEVYWDRLGVAIVEDPGTEVRSQRLPLLAARLEHTGFALRTTGPQRLPHYDYDRLLPLWDTRHQAGFYTRFGGVADLVQIPDDAVAIFGPGEEIHLEFAAPTAELPEGWKRIYVLESEGWCKDMDLYTRDGSTVEPLPTSGRGWRKTAALNKAFNTRYMSGHE